MRENAFQEPTGASPFPAADFQEAEAGFPREGEQPSFEEGNVRGKPVCGELKFHGGLLRVP